MHREREREREGIKKMAFSMVLVLTCKLTFFFMVNLWFLSFPFWCTTVWLNVLYLLFKWLYILCRNSDWGNNHARIQQRTLRMVLTLLSLNNGELWCFNINAMYISCIHWFPLKGFMIPKLLKSAQLWESMYGLFSFYIQPAAAIGSWKWH